MLGCFQNCFTAQVKFHFDSKKLKMQLGAFWKEWRAQKKEMKIKSNFDSGNITKVQKKVLHFVKVVIMVRTLYWIY